MAGSGGTLTWSTTSVTLAVGETITVNYTTTFSEVQSANFTSLIASVATFTEGANKIDLTGTAAGTVTIAANTTVGFETVTTNALTITVTSADDQNFLNERGLARFWGNIDDIKQNKLTAGAGISITNDVISATGGGVADSVAWGHITGSMSSQTDLTTALAAKANSADLATVATSGDYDDLTDKPTIGNATLTIQKNGTSAGTFTANATSNKTINITVPTTAADVSALPASTKYGASIAVSINTTDYKVTTTLKDQDGNTLGTAQVIDLPLESVVVNGSYDNTNKKIVLTLQNGNTIDIPVADLVAGLQSEITSSNKLSSDLVDDTNHTHKFVTAAQITKLNGIASGAEVNVQADWTESNSSSDAYIQNKPSLATVATSGSYNDLSNKPTIPTVNNATLTIQKNGTTVETFTANASSDVTANITVPINVSELTNDAGYLTSVTWGDVTGKPTFATVATSGSYNDLSDKPTIPTVNDATLTITQNGTSVGTFTANASSNATIDVNAPKLTSLVGSVQTSDYHRSVVALCEVASGSGSAVNSWSSGKLVAHRNNGAYGVVEIGINIEAKRSTAYYSNVSYFSNIALLSPTANINTDLGFRPCTFKYNNVYYAGIEFYISSSSASNVYFSGVGNFDVFGLDYYSVSHGSTASSVLNSEVYNSLNYTQWNEERNQWHVGRATRDIIYNNGSGTNANFSTTSAMSNYDEVEICYRDNNQNYAFKRVPGPAGNFVLDMVHPGANSIAYWYISRYIVSGTNITVGANNMRKAIGSTSVTTTAAQDIYITRIVGIRN